MFGPPIPDPLDARPVIRSALAAGLDSRRIRRFLDELRSLATEEAGLALRLAMVLACIRQFDVAVIGYSGFGAFCRERVDWRPSWVRALVRLVESPLDLVKAAAAAGHLPLRLAVRAPGRVSVQEQEAWLGSAVLEAPAPAGSRRVVVDRDADIVARARDLARVCMGRHGPLTELDAYILRHWRLHVPGLALEEGRTPPPAPDPFGPDFAWADASSGRRAPAQALLGPWQEPADLDEALAQFEAVQAVRRSRVAVLARAFALLGRDALRRAGFDSPWAFAERALGWSRRTAWRYLELGRSLTGFPQLDRAVQAGVAPEAAGRIGGLAADQATCDRWIRLARHLGLQELQRALADGGQRLGAYERALEIARRRAAELLGPDGPTSWPSGTVERVDVGVASGGEEAVMEEGRVSSAGDPPAEGEAVSGAGAREIGLRVALPPPPPRATPVITGHPDLVEASRWFLENNPLGRPSGFASRKHLVRYRCENPECGRVTLRVEVHHVHWRRHGGADDLANAVALCPACHLRCVHTGDERIRITRVVVEGLEALLWQYPKRPPVLQFRQVPPERRRQPD